MAQDDDDQDVLDKLAESVADGDSIDWESLERLPPNDARRRLLEYLRIVDEIAEQHRSAVDDPVVSAASTGSIVDPHPHISHIRDPAGAPGDIGKWGHLALRRKIGEGAYGEVFHAHDSWLDHPVALKLLKPDIAQSDHADQILHEARRLARVRHPNVVSVHGADMHDGRIGFWMDLIEGVTLADLVSDGRLSPGEASHIGQEVCLALAAVHLANFVHRDVKAQNVMRASDGGRIILMDFGAGEVMHKQPRGGRVRGTPLYLAPEIFKGGSATIATDIYALGVLLFHLVTGGYPVNGASIESLVDAHMKGDRRRLRDFRPDLPASFIAIVERAIDPDPERRFASAGDFYAALTGEESKAKQEHWYSLRRLGRATLIVGAAATAAEALGFYAARLFQATLRVDPAFAAGPADYFRIGIGALFPFAVMWTVAASLVAVLWGLRPLYTGYLAAIRKRWSTLTASLDPSVLPALLVGLSVLGFAWITWEFREVYTAIEELGLNPQPATLDLSILGPAGREIHRMHSQVSVVLTFLLGLALWRWFPVLERHSDDTSRLRALRWAAIVLIALLVAAETTTRPFLWDRREVVLFENRPAFVIGSNAEELLLYTPAQGERRFLRVRQDVANLRRNFSYRALFDAVQPVQ